MHTSLPTTLHIRLPTSDVWQLSHPWGKMGGIQTALPYFSSRVSPGRTQQPHQRESRLLGDRHVWSVNILTRSKAATERSENSVFFIHAKKKTQQFWFIFPADNKILGDLLLTSLCFYVLFLFCFFVMRQRLDRSPATACGSMTVNNKNT